MKRQRAKPANLTRALAHLRSYPQVDIYLSHDPEIKLSAIYEGGDAGSLLFTIYNGPAASIGTTIRAVIDGGDTVHETAMEFTDLGFTLQRGEHSLGILYRNRRPWSPQGGHV